MTTHLEQPSLHVHEFCGFDMHRDDEDEVVTIHIEDILRLDLSIHAQNIKTKKDQARLTRFYQSQKPLTSA